MNGRLEEKLGCESENLHKIWQALRMCVARSGIKDAMTILPGPDQAEYSLQVDPFDKGETLLAVWKTPSGVRQGELQIRPDGTVFAEMDIVRDHPNDVRWFVEAVTAWGRPESIKTELRLLPAV